MTRALISAVLLVVVLSGGLVLGAVGGFCDTDPWPDDE